MKKIIKHLLSLFLCIVLTTGAMLPAASAATLNKASDASEQVCVDIIQLTDMHGRIGTSADAIGGRMAVLIESVRQNNKDGTLLLGGGDFYTDSSNFDLGTSHEWAMRQWMDYVGFDVEVVGNHEFDRDFENVRGYMLNSPSALICCNIFNEDGTPIADKGSVIIEKSGIRILIVGSMAELPYGVTGLDRIDDPTACTKLEIDRYSPDDYDIIIPLIHGDSAPVTSLAKLADEGYPIACVFGGHSHDTAAKDYYTPGGRHVPYYVANPYNEGLAYLRLYYSKQSGEVTISEASLENSILNLPTEDPKPGDPYYDVFTGACRIVENWESEAATPSLIAASVTRSAVKQTDNVMPKTVTSGSCGASLTWSLDAATGTLTMEGSGEMDSYGADNVAPWESYKARITSLVLPSGLTTIGCSAFSEFTALKSVTLPDTVKDIEPWAFFGCSSLETINLPSGMKSIGRYAFYGCSVLNTIAVPEGVTALGECAFRCCDKLEELTIADSVAKIGYGVIKNTPVYNTAEWDTGALYIGKHLLEVKEAQNAFIIKDGTLSIADCAFTERETMSSLTIPNTVRRIGEWAFYDCSALSRVDIPDSVSEIGAFAFYCCTGITTLNIGSGVSSIGYDAFYFCTGLSAVNAVNIKDIAKWCVIYFEGLNSNPLYYARKIYLNGALLTDLEVPDGVTQIGQYAFSLCESLKNVKLPDTVTAIGKFAFFNCSSMNIINIPDKVRSIEESAFQFCYFLNGVVLPARITALDKNAFNSCNRLRYVIFIGEPPVIDATAFEDAAPLTTACVYYHNTTAWEGFNKQSFGGNLLWLPLEGQLTSALRYTIEPVKGRILASGADSMPSISGFKPWIWEALQSYIKEVAFDKQVKSVASWSFANLSGVESVVLPKNILSVGGDAFINCKSLRSLYILNSSCSISASSATTLGVPGSTVIYGYANSTAQAWAKNNGYTFKLIGSCQSDGHVYVYTQTVQPTCTQPGYSVYTCALCAATKQADITAALGHCYVNGVCTQCGEIEPDPNDPCLLYTDINRKSWYHSAADFVIARGYMGSTKTDAFLFEPNTPCTRSMIVSVLYRLNGTPEVTASNPFTDVRDSFWYTNAILWAADNGVVAGDGKGHFMPNDIMTREQMAVVLKGYTEKILKKDVSAAADLDSFPDANKVTWSKAALRWAVAVGLVSGKSNNGTTILDPQGKATRAEVASVLMRFIQNIATDS